MYEPAGQHSERGSGLQSPWTFSAYLEAYPEAQDVLRRRIEERPEYRAWLQNMGGTVLAILDPAGADGTRPRP